MIVNDVAISRMKKKLERLKRRKETYELVLWILLKVAAEYQERKDVVEVLESLRKVVANWINVIDRRIKELEKERIIPTR